MFLNPPDTRYTCEPRSCNSLTTFLTPCVHLGLPSFFTHRSKEALSMPWSAISCRRAAMASWKRTWPSIAWWVSSAISSMTPKHLPSRSMPSVVTTVLSTSKKAASARSSSSFARAMASREPTARRLPRLLLLLLLLLLFACTALSAVLMSSSRAFLVASVALRVVASTWAVAQAACSSALACSATLAAFLCSLASRRPAFSSAFSPAAASFLMSLSSALKFFSAST
mmetsp:Transcript_85718/g.232312  ORF Transcript_85718/g.232312 Transcript_85718/m.232312 type:complete len:227 (+) Transcript_85718:492-1172(+)